MSLYGDLPPPSTSQTNDSSGVLSGLNPSLNETKDSVTTSTVTLISQSTTSTKQNPSSVAVPHFLPTAIRRPQAVGSKFTMFRKPPVFKPTIAAGAPVAAPQPIVSYVPPVKSLPTPIAPPSIAVSIDEYDPKLPNDFAEMQRLRNESRVAAIAEKALNIGKRSRSSSCSSRSSSRSPPREVGRYAAIPPPADLNSPPEDNNAIKPKVASFASSGEEAYLRRLQMSQKAPLNVPTQSLTQSTNDSSNSPILLLINMVGRGDVDITLESEVKQECSKFGPIKKVLVHEVPPPFPDSQAVRIFVEFDSNISSSRAQSALNGRFFDGRAIQAKFFDPIRFHTHDLAPTSD